jgi:hypothetical protein
MNSIATVVVSRGRLSIVIAPLPTTSALRLIQACEASKSAVILWRETVPTGTRSEQSQITIAT